MIDAASIGEILSVYAKHGWLLRRVLLSPALKKQLKMSAGGIFGAAPVFESDVDAVWFSRPPKPGGVAWEIRHLSEMPYALLENIDESGPECESALHAVEVRLREITTTKTGLDKSRTEQQT